jgi:hypothetical protein
MALSSTQPVTEVSIRLTYYGTLKEAGREEDLKLAGEDRSPKMWIEAGTNYGSWRLIRQKWKELIDNLIIIITSWGRCVELPKLPHSCALLEPSGL